MQEISKHNKYDWIKPGVGKLFSVKDQIWNILGVAGHIQFLQFFKNLKTILSLCMAWKLFKKKKKEKDFRLEWAPGSGWSACGLNFHQTKFSFSLFLSFPRECRAFSPSLRPSSSLLPLFYSAFTALLKRGLSLEVSPAPKGQGEPLSALSLWHPLKLSKSITSAKTDTWLFILYLNFPFGMMEKQYQFDMFIQSWNCHSPTRQTALKHRVGVTSTGAFQHQEQLTHRGGSKWLQNTRWENKSRMNEWMVTGPRRQLSHRQAEEAGYMVGWVSDPPKNCVWLRSQGSFRGGREALESQRSHIKQG